MMKVQQQHDNLEHLVIETAYCRTPSREQSSTFIPEEMSLNPEPLSTRCRIHVTWRTGKLK